MNTVENKLVEQNLYNSFLENMPVVCVDILIFWQGSYLLVRRKNEPAKGKLWFPGGRIFKNEKSEAAAIRVAKDEVGLNCSVRKFLGVYETIFNTGPNNIPVHTVNLTYFLHALNSDVKLDANHSEYMWVNQSRSPEELDSRLKEFIEIVFGNEV